MKLRSKKKKSLSGSLDFIIYSQALNTRARLVCDGGNGENDIIEEMSDSLEAYWIVAY
jgi:hypothetical protein